MWLGWQDIDRIETAEKIAQQRLLIKSKTNKVASTSIEAGVYGYNFPDALVARPLVGLYSSEKDGTELAYLLPEGNKDNYSKEYNWYFGGYNNSPSDSNVFAGKNRYETSISVANAFKNVLNKNFNTIILVNGENYPDALSASVLSAKYNAPILLTPSKNVYQNLTNYIKNNNIKNIIVVGGNNSINSNVANTYASKAIAPTPKPVPKPTDKPTDKPTSKPNTNVSHETIGGIIHGNRDSGIYHVPGQRYYNKIKPENLRFFNTEAEAIRAGYRKSKI